MRKYLPHILIISFVFLLAPTAHVATYAGSLEDAKEEVRNNPDDAWAHCNLANIYYLRGKYKEAFEEYKQAIRIDPDYANAHYLLGLAYDDIGDRKYALKEYEILKELDTELARMLFNHIYRE